MNEQEMRDELFQWRLKLLQKPSVWSRTSKQMQKKLNHFIPEKFHEIMTTSIQKMIEATLKGNEYLPIKMYHNDRSLEEKEEALKHLIQSYRKAAALEGAGTGAGGIFLGIADFPLFLSIKMKFLFEAAALYGFDTDQYEERLFLLYVFQFAFSREEHKIKMLSMIENWAETKAEQKQLDWRSLQQEYRDYLDIVKLLQIMPGFGAVVGGVANYHLVKHLGECVKYLFRMRLLSK